MKRRVVVIALATVLLGCSDPFTPEQLAGTYSLATMDAHTLPQLLTATVECDEWVQSGDLTLQQSGEFMLAIHGKLNCTRGGGPVQVVGWEYRGTYDVSGKTLTFVSPLYPSGELHFTGTVDLWGRRIVVQNLELHLSNAVDLEFRL